MLPRLYTVAEVCAWLGGISRQAVHARVKAGTLPEPVKLGRTVRFREADLLALLNNGEVRS
jgi:excisionase family DNA binding protein